MLQKLKDKLFKPISKREKLKNRLSFYMVSSVFVLLIGMYIFGVGYHNTDMGHNMVWLESEFGLELIDVTLQGIQVTGSEGYRMGHWQIRTSMLLFMMGGMMFGISFTELLNLLKE